ncbi:MAG TPA: SDR family NAD(P)-dependent oxidoreductase [Roseiarcus sp.]|nr:SDR family NAD(P)-dependent oxidoreductase [Roseiarcus sp.]
MVLLGRFARDSGEIAIVGRACRLPGAPNVAQLWELLSAGRCAVSTIPADRWPLARHWHPSVREAGRSYTWAAGILPDIWGFDPSVFRVSPREAQQMDPQQRLLLELAFEACEDAGLAPSKLAGTETGVYVGASALDYSTIGLHDPAVGDAYYATGNTLSIVANRLSYIFDLHGPSIALDTACSSSLVALHEARHALCRGEVDAALVGGVNILASPFQFVTFSQATMLSPTGLCRAFAAEADGYVRAEGGVVLVLKTLKRAVEDGDRIHAVICGSAVNSDGRTSGISLPAEQYQTELLRSAYDKAGVAPDSVVYVEAHGTGTRVGDPVEASALGKVLGRARARPLPIGSIKSNIGHTEPASGLAGLLKAMLALDHDEAPSSLHFENPNPNIDFAGLNLVVTGTATPLPRQGQRRYAGVSSFGFGGTSAHVVIADPPGARQGAEPAPRLLMLSAQTDAALRALADQYAGRLDGAGESQGRLVMAATDHRRERMRERLVAPAQSPADVASALSRFAQSGQVDADAVRATATDEDGSIVFVFSGNGSQFPGMGRAAYHCNAAFRDALDEIDSHFAPLSGWSLAEELVSPDLKSDLVHAHVAQPIMFAIQLASVRALADVGIRPSMTMGHSVGEVAAAEAAGVLSLTDAVRVIYNRSRLQEATENSGGMAVIFGARDAATSLVARIEDLSIAAHNSHHCLAVAGPHEALDYLEKLAPSHKLRQRRLNLVYPFHTELMEPVRDPLLESLADLTPSAGAVPFLSTIVDGLLPGAAADASYWWRNVRDTVLFQEGVERAARLGKRVFLEIGPRPSLKTHLRDVTTHLGVSACVDCVLDEKSDGSNGDPFEWAAMRLLAAGADMNLSWAFGPDPGAGVDLPAYPWRRTEFRFAETSESTGQLSLRPRHPLIGARDSEAALEWRTTLDPRLEPALADHQVDGQVLLPGAAFVEMGLAVARDWAGAEASLSGFEILQPMIFTPDASREILCRVSSSTATVEIMSRPRLSKTAFATHARGKVIQKPGPVPVIPPPAECADGVDASEIYARALASGLEFGPAFRRLARAKAAEDGTILVELTGDKGDARFGLDPAQLDSCFHGLILLFAGRGSDAGAYLPVRFEEARLYSPGRLARAAIHVRRRDDRVILADFDLFDDEGALAATLRGARYQSIRVRSAATLEQYGLVRTWIPSTRELDPREHSIIYRESPANEPRDGLQLPPAAFLVEAWATGAAYELARQLADDGRLDVDLLAAQGRLPPGRRRWLESALAGLEQSGLARRAGSVFRLSDQALPETRDIFAALAAQHPERAPELLLAASIGASLRDFGKKGAELTPPTEGFIEAYELRSPSAVAAARALGARLSEVRLPEGAGFALRVLQIGVGPAMSETLRFAAGCGGRVTLLDPDPARLERARLKHGEGTAASFCNDLDALPDHSFDLIVSAGGLSRLAVRSGALPRLAEKCSPDALIIAVEPAPSLFRDLILGLTETDDRDQRELRLTAAGWTSECSSARLAQIDARLIDTGADHAVALTAKPADRPARPFSSAPTALLCRRMDPDGCATALFDAIKARGAPCQFVEPAAPSTHRTGAYVWIADALEENGTARVASNCLALRDIAVGLGHAKAKLFVVVPSSDRAVAEAVLSFVRTLANEFATIDFRRVLIADSSPASAESLATVVLSNVDETDLEIDGESVRVLRYAAPDSRRTAVESGGGLASRLEKSAEGGLDRIAWKAVECPAPTAHEIEVEVSAAGLNFRDVMWALSILPDEMLEDGFAGPTLGLEFSGRVTRVGSSVDHLNVGDPVVGLCGGAFASHVVVDVEHAAKIPEALGCESAATVPVSFLTAYYSLVCCADLKRDEWVLIHGGAGGVGLAALQIARWRGARPIVTAGSPEKRALTRALGAEHAFDSRSGSFVDDVMRATEGRGVSVVLNSLAGEAMERSLGLLQPFGRFVELGKRDYLANTPIGLRPFRRNLSYFGVDLDQLLASRPDVSRQLFAAVLALFASGDFTPLPYSVFAHDEVVEAMRLMQQSGHIGKILIRPPPRTVGAFHSKRSARFFEVDPGRTHLLVGGLGGFGLAAAEWLVERGARHLVLVGRSGAASQSAREKVAAIRSKGAQVQVASLDIADRRATERFFTDLAETMPPLAGVMHAAMVLDDAIAANLDEARLLKVLRPKIAGAENLDELTRGLTLDYFILFSSATTVIGNPGQGAYVAANGFLEGLARERRSIGLPALAVSWGAIGDVGVLAHHGATREALAHRAGVKPMKARAALEMMALALSFEGGPGGDGAVVIADVNWSAARAHLPLLSSPSYNRLSGDANASDVASESVVDLRTLVARFGAEQARSAVADILVDEIARILRLPRDDVSKTKPLTEIGVDSLMAVELALSLETRFAMDSPLGNSPGGFTVWELADYLLSAREQDNQRLEIAKGLAKRHLDKADWGDIAPLMTALQERGVDLAQASRQSESA